ncbi:uncharacterized protein BO87DRAFT_461350 [Aspergillus neoniger CBS 115656]|uniref:Uncharacterized protein n=1 Tax=Aspergillus neoniger (strain CBS 115656) TaxID=1448310 RepID=A0A318YBW6_ASPNB|nr:hypothetical protein BO87DRAFT_461350 [Aspergillus neoniger CBS 115656]PYH31589.1 hypothetical protein BO87DRAFT_461350 [Aspergillus neoniger CBS 115656]
MDQFPFPWASTPNENTLLSTSADGNYFDEVLGAEITTAPLVAASSSWMYQNGANLSSFQSPLSLQPEFSVHQATYQPVSSSQSSYSYQAEPWYQSAPNLQSGPSYQPAPSVYPTPPHQPVSSSQAAYSYQAEPWYQPATNFQTGPSFQSGPSFHQLAMQAANPASVQHATGRYASLGPFQHPLNVLHTQEAQYNSNMSAQTVGNEGFDFGLPLTGNGNARRARTRYATRDREICGASETDFDNKSDSSLTSDAIGRIANIRHLSTGSRD